MNEALRCDRISLMHAGEVLVYDEPQHLVEAKGAASLEEAFINYLKEAIGTTAEESTDLASVQPDDSSTLISSPSTTLKRHYFSLNRLLAYSYLEMMAVMRDRIRLAFAFFGSVILLIVIAYGISLDIEDLTFAALDLDRTPESRQYLSNFQGSHYFIERPELQSKDELEWRLKSNDITLAIEIPPGFGRDLKTGQTPSISAWIDGANTTRASTIEGYVTGGHIRYLTELATNAGIDARALYKVDLQSRYRYNPSFESIFSIGPKTPALLLLFFPAILMAVSISREKEVGTITNFYVTPTNKLEFLIGKQLPYIGIGMANFFILTFLVVFLLQVPLKGSLLGLTVGAFFYVCASTGIGLIVSALTKTQVTAVFATTIVSLLPTALFSGLVQPTSTLEGGGYLIGMAWPATYYMHLSVAAFTKGLDFFALSGDLMMLSIYGPLFVVLAAVCLTKQEA